MGIIKVGNTCFCCETTNQSSSKTTALWWSLPLGIIRPSTGFDKKIQDISLAIWYYNGNSMYRRNPQFIKYNVSIYRTTP